ncbi:RNA polymerase sigma factor [Ferruginibacter sp. SUN106]|uniref:RNA polymerase sigma factor n=1 Tax=Ferruginibacter sp. SUN106 TaxID=2978348 RepID=UPI003D35B80B
MNQPELIVQLQQGDEQAFKKLVDEWQDMVYNTALGIVQNEDDADDITQDVFIQVYQSVRSFKGESKFSTWLYRIVISKALDHVKKKKRKKRFAFVQSLFGTASEEEIHPEEFNHPGVLMENRERAAELFKAMEQLPDNQRIAFTLHKLEAQKHQDIAAIMNISLTAVESLIARAKGNLRKTLNAYYTNNNF